jgi:hypothetical protein
MANTAVTDNLVALDPLFRAIRERVADEGSRKQIYRTLIEALISFGADPEELAYLWQPPMDVAVSQVLNEMGLVVPDEIGEWAL